MNFQCLNEECKKTFHYAAKHQETNTADPANVSTVETYRCPYCNSLNIAEAPQETAKPAIDLQNISSMIDVNPNEVDVKLAEGYVVAESWQKNIRLVKPKSAST